ncbi:MAG: Lrp/AsnC family transcriptional regulator [Promethearchaeota archaeon]
MKNKKINKEILIKFNSKSKPDLKQISKELNISQQTLKNKLKYMKQKKIINNSTININPFYPLNLKYIFLKIKTNPQEPHLVRELLKIKQLRMLDGIFGEFSLIGMFVFNNLDEYYQVLGYIDTIMAKSYFKKYQIIEPIKVFKINGINLQNSKIGSRVKLDEIDRDILTILQENNDLKYLSTYKIKIILNEKYKKDSIKREVSQPTIYNRIKKLENEKIILNYTLRFCPRKIGFDGKYIVRIKPKDPSKYDLIAQKLELNKCITDLFRIGEHYGLFAIVRVKKVKDYRDFIKNLYETGEIEDTWTNFVLDELVPFTNFILF